MVKYDTLRAEACQTGLEAFYMLWIEHVELHGHRSTQRVPRYSVNYKAVHIVCDSPV